MALEPLHHRQRAVVAIHTPAKRLALGEAASRWELAAHGEVLRRLSIAQSVGLVSRASKPWQSQWRMQQGGNAWKEKLTYWP